MNHEMIQNWNQVVKPEDSIIHCGDFALGKKDQSADILAQLNGYKILILGNHDKNAKQMKEIGFNEVYQEYCTNIGPKSKRILFCHRPPDNIFKQKHLGVQLFLHGHTHSYNIKTENNVLNISAEALNFIPIDLEYLVNCYA